MIIVTKAQAQGGPKKDSQTPYSCNELGSIKYQKKAQESASVFNKFTEPRKTSCGWGYGSEVDDASRKVVLCAFSEEIPKNQ